MNNPLAYLQGTTFVVTGPYLVADLDHNPPIGELESQYGKHGMEEVPVGTKTQAHRHAFLSLYHAAGLAVLDEDGVKHTLPEHALVLVPPGVEHSWIPSGTMAGRVGSLDHRHEQQKLRAA